MTAKNRILISVLAIITTLVVAGSMIFVIFAATSGNISGGVYVHYYVGRQLYGTVTTRFTQVPLSTGFGNGGGDVLVKTADGKDYVEFKGWADQEDQSTSLKPLTDEDIHLSLNTPWVIFQVSSTLNCWTTGSGAVLVTISLGDGVDCHNVEVRALGIAETAIEFVSPESLANLDGSSFPGATGEGLLESSWTCSIDSGESAYYMIKVADPSQDAWFKGTINCMFVENT